MVQETRPWGPDAEKRPKLTTVRVKKRAGGDVPESVTRQVRRPGRGPEAEHTNGFPAAVHFGSRGPSSSQRLRGGSQGRSPVGSSAGRRGGSRRRGCSRASPRRGWRLCSLTGGARPCLDSNEAHSSSPHLATEDPRPLSTAAGETSQHGATLSAWPFHGCVLTPFVLSTGTATGTPPPSTLVPGCRTRGTGCSRAMGIPGKSCPSTRRFPANSAQEPGLAPDRTGRTDNGSFVCCFLERAGPRAGALLLAALRTDTWGRRLVCGCHS